MSIHRLHVRNFMGLRLVDYEFPPGGAVIAGGNGRGKTSALLAIRAALAAQGVGEEAIAKGEDQAEILIDLDEVTVRRLITRKSNSLTITRADGTKQREPQAYLNALLGVAPIDPIDLVMEADPKKRRAAILAAMPVSVSVEQLERWAPGIDLAAALGRGSDGRPNVSAHGFEVVEKVRAAAYDARATANRLAKQAKEQVDRALAAATMARAEVVAPAFGQPGEEPAALAGDADPVAWAQANLEAAGRAEAIAQVELEQVRARAEAARQEGARAARTRARVAELRAQAQAAIAGAPAAPDEAAWASAKDRLDEANRTRNATLAEVERLRAALAEAEAADATALAALGACHEAIADLDERAGAAEAAADRAIELSAQAEELAAATGGDAAPAPEEEAEAQRKVDVARAALRRARAEVAYRQRVAETDAAQAEEARVAARAAELDAAVKALTTEAPAVLISASGGVPGLEVDGTTVRLDGVELDRLSGAEQLRFAVAIARRLNAKSKLLVVDGLERLDADQLPVFLEEATADGFQLIATRVDRGAAHLEPIGGAQ